MFVKHFEILGYKVLYECKSLFIIVLLSEYRKNNINKC